MSGDFSKDQDFKVSYDDAKMYALYSCKVIYMSETLLIRTFLENECVRINEAGL